MRMNRVQFQPGLSMPEFFERYGTEGQCQAALQSARWPRGFVCPKCGANLNREECGCGVAMDDGRFSNKGLAGLKDILPKLKGPLED